LRGGSEPLIWARASLEGHLLTFAAEKARVEGTIVDMDASRQQVAPFVAFYISRLPTVVASSHVFDGLPGGGQDVGMFGQHLEGRSESCEWAGHERPLLTGVAFASSFFGHQMDLQMGIESFGHALHEGERR
jgi:hypothetical protein